MKSLFSLFVFFFLIFQSLAQIPENYVRRYKIKREEGFSYESWQGMGPSRSINYYNDNGLLIRHVQPGDNSGFREMRYMYDFLYNGRVKNRIVMLADNKVHDISLYEYFTETEDPRSPILTYEYHISLLSNQIDTFKYDPNGLLLSDYTQYSTHKYIYNDRSDLIAIKTHKRFEQSDTTLYLQLKYNSQGLLLERSVDRFRETMSYDKTGRLVSREIYNYSTLLGKLNYFYN